MRGILAAVKHVPVAGRIEIDALLGDHVDALANADPDRLVELAEDEAARLRPDLTLAREDRAIRQNFLAIQGRLDGGSQIYGQADAESTATLVEALDSVADAPHHPDLGGPSRAQQRFDALLHLCEASLAGGAETRPRPRLIATLDVAALGTDQALRVLHGLTGRPARLSRVAADSMLCDATIVPVLTEKGRPIAVGDAATPVTGKLRSALVARDGGCRFPGCHAPASWADGHGSLNQSLQHLRTG